MCQVQSAQLCLCIFFLHGIDLPATAVLPRRRSLPVASVLRVRPWRYEEDKRRRRRSKSTRLTTLGSFQTRAMENKSDRPCLRHVPHRCVFAMCRTHMPHACVARIWHTRVPHVPPTSADEGHCSHRRRRDRTGRHRSGSCWLLASPRDGHYQRHTRRVSCYKL